jgi:ClpP class serine protease
VAAAYWIASAADELVVTPSGQVGSIGVFAAHEDISKAAEMQGVKVTLISAGQYKTEGNPFEPLSAEARAAMQKDVNTFGDMFVNAVARNRGVGAYSVKAGFGQGRMVMAQDAVKASMADRVATLDETLARLLNVRRGKGLSAKSEWKRELAAKIKSESALIFGGHLWRTCDSCGKVVEMNGKTGKNRRIVLGFLLSDYTWLLPARPHHRKNDLES